MTRFPDSIAIKDDRPDSGCVIVFGAGNLADEGVDSVAYPARYDDVIAVGAIDSANSRWDYSQYGGALDLMAPSGSDGDEYGAAAGDMYSIDLEGDRGWHPGTLGSGPGGNNDYTHKMGGTSAACPLVAGVASLVFAKRPDLRVCGTADTCYVLDTVLSILAQSADDLEDEGWDPETGYGTVNAFRALLSVSRGEINNDGVWNVLDVVAVVNEAFRGADPQGFHPGLADMNCDGVTNVLDVVLIVNIAFRAGVHPSPCYRTDY